MNWNPVVHVLTVARSRWLEEPCDSKTMLTDLVARQCYNPDTAVVVAMRAASYLAEGKFDFANAIALAYEGERSRGTYVAA